MTPSEAREVLGLGSTAPADEARVAYRRLIRAHHPDIDRRPGSHARAARITRAYALLADIPTPDRVSVKPSTPDVFARLVEAADIIGTLSWSDRDNGLLSTVVRFDGWPACSLLIMIEQAGDEVVADCTLDSLEAVAGPPIEQVVRELQHVMRALAE